MVRLQNISLEATRLCNLKCIMCPTHKMNADPGIIRKYPPYFDMGQYKSILDQLEAPMHIGPQFQGEPLLNKNVFEMVKIAHDKGFATGFSTNAVLLTEENGKKLIESGLDALCISVHGLVSETVEAIEVGADFQKIRHHIEGFLVMRDGKPSVCINIESVSISNVWNDEGVSQFHYKPERFPCNSLWTNMIVLTNGDVIPCCNPHWDLVMGNAFETPIMDIFNGPMYEKFRQLHTEGRYEGPCARCDTWMTSSSYRTKERGYLVAVYPFHKIYYKDTSGWIRRLLRR